MRIPLSWRKAPLRDACVSICTCLLCLVLLFCSFTVLACCIPARMRLRRKRIGRKTGEITQRNGATLCPMTSSPFDSALTLVIPVITPKPCQLPRRRPKAVQPRGFPPGRDQRLSQGEPNHSRGRVPVGRRPGHSGAQGMSHVDAAAQTVIPRDFGRRHRRHCGREPKSYAMLCMLRYAMLCRAVVWCGAMLCLLVSLFVSAYSLPRFLFFPLTQNMGALE